jgi:hypothetical protein
MSHRLRQGNTDSTARESLVTQQDEAIGIVSEAETLAAAGGGAADPVSIRKIEGLVTRLKNYPGTADKPQNVLDWAKVLFSTRKHRRYG